MDRGTELTPVAQDYLKIVWSAQEWSTKPVTTKLLAERLGVGVSTVSETVRRLSHQGLLVHAPYGAITLSEEGRARAVSMVRRHRLLETFLVRELGYGWHEVHDEAEVLEHAVSDTLIERMDERMGRPRHDPHGDPIPSADGTVEQPHATILTQLPPGRPAVVARVSDADPRILRRLAECGLGLDCAIVVRNAKADTVSVTWHPRGTAGGPGADLTLEKVAAEQIWVVPTRDREGSAADR